MDQKTVLSLRFLLRRHLHRYVNPRRGETRGIFWPFDVVVIRLILKFDDHDEEEDSLTVVASCVISLCEAWMNETGMNLRRQNAHRTTCQMSSRHWSILKEMSVHAQNRRDGSYNLLSSHFNVKRKIHNYNIHIYTHKMLILRQNLVETTRIK